MSGAHFDHPAGEDATIAIVANRGPHDFVWEDGKWVARARPAGW